MKKLLLVASLIISISFANDLEWSDSFQTAKNEAQSLDKLILVMFTQEECSTCEYMKEVTFENEVLSEYMQNSFILLEVDMYDKKALEHLKVYGTPTTYILDKEGNKIGRQIIGGATAPAFLKVLKEYKEKSNRL